MLWATRYAWTLPSDPSSANLANTNATTECTCSSGSNAMPPSGERTYPIGTQVNNSPRLALFNFPWCIRDFST